MRKAFVGMCFLLILVLLVWVLTGGVAIQRVRRFDMDSSFDLTPGEQVSVKLEGTVRSIYIPFVYCLYDEKEPFQLVVRYQNHDPSSPTVIRILEIHLRPQGANPIALVSPNAVIEVQALEHISPVFMEGKTKEHRSLVATVNVGEKVLSFNDSVSSIECEVQLEVVGKTKPQRYDLVLRLILRRNDIIQTFWKSLEGA